MTCWSRAIFTTTQSEKIIVIVTKVEKRNIDDNMVKS